MNFVVEFSQLKPLIWVILSLGSLKVLLGSEVLQLVSGTSHTTVQCSRQFWVPSCSEMHKVAATH